MDERSRSRSPGRRSERDRDRPKKSGGFRWKDKRRDDNDRPEDERRLNRGYRERSPRRERESDRRDERDRNDERQPSRPERDDKEERRERKKEKKEKKKKAAVAEATEPTMVVYVNDRLGTKAAIPCLGSDPIKLFKAQVAARIGRETHEILLKRQGERPFKDFLTLADYSISHGAQLDLEVGTGD
ncbi:ubiquitin-related domain-containing protein [Aspergillus ambiguus]|uniref:ubiquitin-like protein HUB1 n=1 Tax=Aspergillus ambiguus TaxID=176160 RepID=UPI003CCDCA78